MEDRGNKNIICSVLFLDIVEYSKKTVTGQISLKERFNSYLSEAISDVPVNDRIILDTGDGAAVNFLGDIEASLNAALSLRESFLSEDPALEPELLVRIGINLGPVRLVRDINGQPNIVGDGINVAQRIMAFADPSQILVSRSYFDAVSHISAEYTGMFHYQGSRTDKHVREHEIYAIGYPGDQTTRKMAAHQPDTSGARILGSVKSFFSKPEAEPESSSRRNLYLMMIAAPLALLTAIMLFLPKKHIENQPVASVEIMQPASAPVAETAARTKSSAALAEKPVKNTAPAQVKAAAPKVSPKPVQAKPTVQPAHKVETTTKAAPVVAEEAHAKAAAKKGGAANPFFPDWPGVGSETSKDAVIVVTCKADTEVYVDGIHKGKLGSGPMTVNIKPGKHKLILTHPKMSVYSEQIDVDAGKTEHIKPKVCN